MLKWKLLAITESLLLILGFILIYAHYAGYSISAILCALMLLGFLAGGTGWLILIALVVEKGKGGEHG